MRLALEHTIPSPGKHLCGLAWDGRHLWHSDGDTHTIYQLDPNSGRINRKLACPDVRTSLCCESGFLWQIAGRPKRIRKIDPSDGEVKDEISLSSNAERVCGLLVDGKTYWIGPEQEQWITHHRFEAQELLGRYGPVPSGDGLDLIGDRLWYTSHRAGILAAVDIHSGKEIARFELPGLPTDMCFDGERIWFNHFPAQEICAVRLPGI